jgi:uncharacterized membrane protein
MSEESNKLPQPSGDVFPARPDPPDDAVRPPLSRRTTQVSSYMWVGPYPDPEDLAAYERVFEGAAKEIFQMAKDEAVSQRENERRALIAEIVQGYLGTISATVVAIAGFAMTCYIAHVGGTLAAAVVGSVGIGGIVHIVATGRRASSQETTEEKLPARREAEEPTSE